jgi:uncharacterized membrane protein (DUF2068 family)
MVEALKGAVVLLAAAGVISLVHENAQAVAEEVVRHFHLNPASRYPRIFLDALASLNSSRLWLFAAGAFFYSTVRFVEAYGLWRGRAWAEWLGVISGGLYIPLEIYELFRGGTLIKSVLFATNLVIVVFLTRALQRRRQGLGIYSQT